MSDFEGLNASDTGTVLTGQAGFTLPFAYSSDWDAYTYLNNLPGLPQNPTGGSKFVAGAAPAIGSISGARAQHDLSSNTGGLWTFSYDFAATYIGAVGDASDNIGSFSTQPNGSSSNFVQVLSWVDPADPVSFNAFYVAYDVSGAQFNRAGESPGSAWEGLSIDNWYRGWTTADYDLNRIIEAGIMDLQGGGGVATFKPH